MATRELYWKKKKKLEKGMNMKSYGLKGFATLGEGTRLNASTISSQIHGPIKERDTSLLRVNKIFLLFVMVVLFMATNCLAAGNTLTPEMFMGPEPGTIYYYKDEYSERTMILAGIRYDMKGNLHVKEVITSPLGAVPFKGSQVEESRYVFSIVGNRLTRQISPEFGGVFVETYLDTGGEGWSFPVTLHKTGEKVKTVCNIVSKTEQMIFGEIRTILEVRGKLCVPCKYASGIGLIEEAGMQLIKIEKQGSTKSE